MPVPVHHYDRLRPDTLYRDLLNRKMDKIKHMYAGLSTEVYVCQCSASLYFWTPCSSKNPVRLAKGIPVLVTVYNKIKRPVEVHVYLAEQQSGLPLWHHKLTTANYWCITSNFHQFKVKTSKPCLYAGLQYTLINGGLVFYNLSTRILERILVADKNSVTEEELEDELLSTKTRKNLRKGDITRPLSVVRSVSIPTYSIPTALRKLVPNVAMETAV